MGPPAARRPSPQRAMNNADVAEVLDRMADLLDIKGEPRYKVVAYQKAARGVAYSEIDVHDLAAAGALTGLPGVGKSLARKITELVETGRLREYEDLQGDLPDGVLRILDVPGIGPKLAYKIGVDLGVTTLEALEKAIHDGRFEALPGVGRKTGENILRSIETRRSKDDRILLGKALPLADEICAALRPIAPNATPAGSLRRREETVGDIDIIAACPDPARAVEVFTGLPFVTETRARGPTKAAVIVRGDLRVDFRVVEEESFGNLLQHFTGSKEHNVLLRERAKRMGLSVSEYGIKHLDTGEVERFRTEEEVYARLGLAWMPPEVRWGRGEIAAAETGDFPKLIEKSDLKGDLHGHTDWSDGRAAIVEMREKAKALGYEYSAITDHSIGRGIANGLSEERLREQVAIVHATNEAADDGFTLLTGTEVDIRADGTLDFSDALLGELDVVVASIHSAMGQDEATMTRRVIRAMENPHVDIIGHLSSRLIGERRPVDLDMEAALEAAARTGTAIEINATPSRLDLRDVYVRRARELGVKLVISTDAHATGHLDGVGFGIDVARRGMCAPGDILNTRPLSEFRATLKPS